MLLMYLTLSAHLPVIRVFYGLKAPAFDWRGFKLNQGSFIVFTESLL